MAAAPPAKKGLSATLTRKVGPLPVWAWAAISLVAGYYLYKRYSAGNAAASTTQSAVSTPATDTTGLGGATGTTGDTSGSGSAGVDPTALIQSLGASDQQGFAQLDTDLQALAAGQLSSYQNGAGGATTGNPQPTMTSTSPQPGGSNAPTFHYTPVPISTPNFAKAAVSETQTAAKAGTTSGFGGVTSVTRTKTGSTITTYASGRQVEQAPGKTAYVIKR